MLSLRSMRLSALAASAIAWLGCHRAPGSLQLVSTLQISDANLAAAPELGSSVEQARASLRAALESTRRFEVVQGSKDKTAARVRLEVESARRVLLPSTPTDPDREQAEVLVSLELLIPDGHGDLDRLVSEGSGHRPTPVDASGGPDAEGRLQAFEGAFQGAMFEAATALSWQVEARKKSDADLEKDLSASDARVRDYAIRALAERRNPAAVPLLLARLDDESPEVVRRAMGALVAIGDPRAVRPLIDLTRKRPPQFVAEVLYALGSLGGNESESFLYTLESGAPDEEVRRAAHEALGDLRRRRDETAAVPVAHPPITSSKTPLAPAGSP